MSEQFSENVEPGLDRIRELDWSKAESMLEARLALMEPEARLILKSIRLHERQTEFEALVDFFGTIELVEDEMSFESAIKVIDTVFDAFDKIDIDHDQLLTEKELEKYSDRRKLDKSRDEQDLEKELESLDWLIRNYRTLQYANILRRSRGISKKDLIEAGNVFRGLKIVQENFPEISDQVKNGEREVTVASVLRYVEMKKTKLSLQDKIALKNFLRYVSRISGADPDHEGITWENLTHLGPEEIWGRANDNPTRDKQKPAD